MIRQPFRLAWRASRWQTLLLSAVIVISAALQPLFMLATGYVIATVPGAVSAGLDTPEGRRLLLALTALAATYLLETVASSFLSVLSGSLSSRFTLELRTRLLEATTAPAGIAHLEDPEIADELRVITGEDVKWYAEQIVVYFTQVATMKLSGLLSLIIVVTVVWWAPLAVIPALWFGFLWLKGEVDVVLEAYELGTQELRRASYIRDLAVKPEAAKELRVFGFGRWIVDAYGASWLKAMKPQWKARKGHAGKLWLCGICEALAAIAVFGTVGIGALNGTISLAEIVVFASAYGGMHQLGVNGDQDMSVVRGAGLVKRYAALRQRLRTPAADLQGTRTVERAGTVVFEDVTFAYPSTSSPVLDGLCLEIPAGRSLAIVGLNGAGKTTLTKLLARLYDPDAGRITVDGIDIREVDPASWHRRIGVIFQDFVRFELDAATNIGLGAPHLLGDRGAVRTAADKAGATAMIERLEHGWDTVLSRGYTDGIDLSGGQWQRIALARALMALEGGADILVLDEPTANLDVRAEAEIFDRFLEISAGATTILISHRFSTVRRADRIAVIEHGRVQEIGSHEELIALNGRYAHLFRLQAERFTDDRSAPRDERSSEEAVDA